MSTIEGIAPVIPVADVSKSVGFYVSHLGFRCQHLEADNTYAVVGRDRIQIHLTGPGNEQALTATRSNFSFVIAVDDVDALWAEISATAPQTRSRAPEDKPWGLRELHILDLDGALLRFAQDG